MADFDPFASGAATAAQTPRPPAASSDFDPFASGSASETKPSFSFPVSSGEDPMAHWRGLYGGIDTVDRHFDPQSSKLLDSVSKDPKEIRARVINQSFIADKTKMPTDLMDSNWEAVKSGYVKKEFGQDVDKISDVDLYNRISERLKPDEKAVSPDEKYGTIKPWAWKDSMESDWYMTKKNIGAFWESINKPFVELPDPPANLPDMPHMGFANPAVAAGVYQGVKPLLQSVESPFGIATIGVGAGLSQLSKAYPLAKVAIAGMSGVFAGTMGIQAVKSGMQVKAVFQNPNSTTQEKVSALTGPVADGLGALAGSLGTVYELMPEKAQPITESLKGKTPTQAAEVLRQEAIIATPEQADALHQAATQFDEVGAYERGPDQWETTTTGPEKIAAAAVKTPDGKISEGITHETIKTEIAKPEEVSEGTPVAAQETPPEGAQEGFVTTTGRFVTREEAAQIAQNQGQLTPDATENPPKSLEAHEVDFERPIQSTFGQTSLKNAYAQLERSAYDFDQATPTEQRSMSERWVRTGEVLEKTPEAGRQLTERLLNNPNIGLDDDQSALLLRHKVGLQNSLNEASDIAADPNSSPELKKEAYRQVTDLSNQLKDFLNAVQRRGSEWGREGRWRQALAHEDFSFASQEMLLRAARGGAELSEEEQMSLKKRVDELEAKQAEYDAIIASRDSVSHTEAADQAVKQMAKPPRAPRRFKTAEAVRQKLSTSADAARQRLVERLLKVNDITQVIAETPAVLKDMAIIGASHLYSTGLDFAKWSSEMVKDLGEKVRPALAQAWDESRTMFHDENKKGLLNELKEKTSEERTKALSSTAQELARGYIEQGVKGRDEVLDKVHEDLKSVIPDLSRRDAMDAISGYGQFKPLTRDQITKELRDIKGQLQQVAKLDDMSQGKAPKKTGMERRSPSDQERRLIQEVEAKKKEGGYEITDPEKQLRSSLQAVKRNLENRIKDLTKEFDTGEAKPAGKPLPTDPEAEVLKSMRDRISGVIESIEKRPEVKPEERIKAALESTTKSIENLESQLNEGKVFPDGKTSEPWSPELGRAKAYLKDLQEFRRDIQKIERPPKAPQERALDGVKTRLKGQIDSLEKQIESRTKTVREKKGVVYDDEANRLKARRDELKNEYDGIFDPKELSNQQRLNIWEAYANRRIAELKERMANKDFAPKARKAPPVFDEKANKVRGELERMKQDFAIERMKAEEAGLPKAQKALRGFAGLSRGLALSGYHTLGKLASFSLTRMIETPAAEAVGALIRQVPGIDDIAAKANMESGAEYSGLAKFYRDGAIKGAQDAYETSTQKGKSGLKAELGDETPNIQTVKWYDYFGIGHAAEKSFLLRGDFELRLEKAHQAAIKNGLDVTDSLVAGAIRKDAFDYANRAILQENNLFANLLKGAERQVMEWASDRPMVQKQMIALRYLFDSFITKGIVKAPTNMILQSLERSPVGLLRAAAYTTYARITGVSGLTAAEANMITRLWKLGAIGSAMFAWGAIDATKDPKDRMFGGFFQSGDKRGADDVQWGRIRVGNTQVPAWITEAPFISAQMGSTFMRVTKSKVSKKDANDRGALAGALSATMALASAAPVANPLSSALQKTEKGEANQILWDWMASEMPQFTDNVAYDLDGKSRAPKGLGQTLELNTPFMRQNVPETKAQLQRDEAQDPNARNINERFKQ